MDFLTLRDAGSLKGKRVILRLTLNVPVDGTAVRNDFRLERVFPTLERLVHAGARVLVISHLGSDGKKSLAPIAALLRKKLPVGFTPEKDLSKVADMVSHMKEGSVLVLENIRRFPGEELNDPDFARELAACGDIYVNEDFAVSHRAHASVVGLPKRLPSFAGPLFAEEVKNVSRVFHPKHPFLFILGGAKFETKLPLVKRFLKIADTIFVSGALANSFFKEMGYEVGKSLVDKKELGLLKLSRNKKIILPKDVTVSTSRGREVKSPIQVGKRENMLDVGPETLEEMAEYVAQAKYILWNGPLGNFEKGYSEMTERLASTIADSDAISIVGGGDTIAAIEKTSDFDSFTFVSTGGGAMLDFLARGTLPGIEALRKSAKRSLGVRSQKGK